MSDEVSPLSSPRPSPVPSELLDRDHLAETLRPEVEQAMKEYGRKAVGEALNRNRRRNRRRAFVALLAGLLASALLWRQVVSRDDDVRSLRGDVSSARDAAQANQQGLAQANRQLRELGGTPVPPPSPQAGGQGEQGSQGEPGPAPTDAQVRSALTFICESSDVCRAPFKLATVRSALREVCPTRAACTGPRGASGSPGPRGQSGSPGPSGSSGASGQPGQTGPGPTDEQIASAFVSYCASRNGCVGPVGPTGERGERGAQGDRGLAGRGIQSVDCTGLGVDRLRITYDDGTTQDVPCDLDPPTDTSTPTPTPSETPS